MPTIKTGRSSASYWIDRDDLDLPPDRLNLINYRQEDGYNCGFIAALTVARYLNPSILSRDVLRATRPSVNWGVDREKMVTALNRLGIITNYRTDLTVDLLRDYVELGVPVIVSVWPEEWSSDHWTVVWGFSDWEGESYIHLTNHWCMTLDEFYEDWSDMDMRSGRGASGEGIVCGVSARKPHLAS